MRTYWKFVAVCLVFAGFRGMWLAVFPEPKPDLLAQREASLHRMGYKDCVNAYGDVFVTNDAEACRLHEVSYPCKYGDTTYSVKDEAACNKKRAELDKDFDPYAYAEELKQMPDDEFARLIERNRSRY